VVGCSDASGESGRIGLGRGLWEEEVLVSKWRVNVGRGLTVMIEKLYDM